MTFGGGTFGLSVHGDGAEGDSMSNLGFEVGTLGRADRWHIDNFSVASVDFAEFGPESEAFDDFETGWNNAPNYLELPSGIAAAFTGANPPGVESFEAGWNNAPFMTTTYPAAVDAFSTGRFVEDFETGWSNDAFVLDLNTSAWLFQGVVLADGMDFEDFENGWSNDTFLFALSSGDLSSASFSSVRALSVENFEFVKPVQSYTASTVTDALTTAAHGLALNYRVILASPVGGSMPTPLAPSVVYYVQNLPDANSFKLALAASAGSPIDITAAGSGLLTWTAPYEFWTTTMSTV